TPPDVIEATKKALDQGAGCVYAPTRGLPRFKELIAKKFKEENGIDADPEKNIIVANGGSGTITLAFASIFNPGDELLLFSPNFVSYFYVSRYFDARIVEVPRDGELAPSLDSMEGSITSKTKAILINSPNNPTGHAISRNDLESICDACIEHDLYLISDEVYEKFLYDGREHVSPASLNGMGDRTITLNALSKTFSTTGFRVGYLAASEEIIPLMENFLQYTGAGVNHPCQDGGIAAMELLLDNPGFMEKIIHDYEKRRDICHRRLNEMGLPCPLPGGAFYEMPSVEMTGMSGDVFSRELVRNKGVAVVPGGTFGSHSRNRVRISYALPEVKLVQALNRMEAFIKAS
ncbi:aminotransferase class I/II-fold pyridoxal phosphate-dependent enzyme, partial [Candidatus Bathyarchaeota archaeon]|nr:aminotransferase class I/II-fold pyridoxal phosphate-dependent enzyme [Candidatus Bathyarchaeota archaeon]